MRKFLIPLAAAASALAVASPASAQVYGNLGVGLGLGGPAYGAPAYGYGYNNYGQVRALQYRIDGVQRQITMLDRRNILSRGEARRLREESRAVERRLQRSARFGLSPYEARSVEVRIARLEQHVQREAWDRDGRWGRGYGYGYDNDRYDREHDRWHDNHDD